MSCCSSKADEAANSFVAISIRIPPTMIDERAQKDKSTTDVTHIHNNFLTKTKFNVEMRDHFNMFDSRERIEAIISILTEQIDFEYY